MGSKINDKSFSFLGDWSETIMRSVFIALVGVAVIALIVCIIWAKSQNMVEEDPQKRKLNNRKIFAGLIVLILVVVMWPLVELIKSKKTWFKWRFYFRCTNIKSNYWIIYS